MSNCIVSEIIKRQIAIFRHVSFDIVARLKKVIDIKGYEDIKNMRFNGTHNGMATDQKYKVVNGMSVKVGLSMQPNNGAPVKGTHPAESMPNGPGTEGSRVNGASNGVNGH